jgi:hypothetical protein
MSHPIHSRDAADRGPDASGAPRSGLPTRLAGAVAAAAVTLTLLSMLVTTLHPARLAEPPQVVQWERITIVGERPAAAPSMAQTEPRTRSN